MQNKSVAALFIIFLLTPAIISGQKQVNSPYSRFNMGSIVPTGSYRSLGMGGTGVAMRDNNSIYFVNPASYSSVDTTSFILDFGADYSTSKLYNGTRNYRSDDMNFGHFMIAFPLSKHIGFAAGLIPVSNGYYNLQQITKSGDSNYDPIAGEIISTHKGDGSFSNFFVGSGVRLTKNISVGANLSILFGEIDRINQFEFTDVNMFNQYNLEKLKIKGANLNYGIQYTGYLKNDYFITAGVAYTSAHKYNSEFIKFSERSTAYSISAYSPDTLYYISSSSKDSTKFPSTLRVGLSFGKKDKFTVGVDYVYTDWSNGFIHGSNRGYLTNSRSVLFGAEYVPDKYSNVSLLKRARYRVGGHFANEYLTINGAQIKEYGASLGFATRMRSYSLSEATFFFDYTKKTGEFSKGLHNESIYSIGLSLNLYDFWFVKRKYD